MQRSWLLTLKGNVETGVRVATAEQECWKSGWKVSTAEEEADACFVGSMSHNLEIRKNS